MKIVSCDARARARWESRAGTYTSVFPEVATEAAEAAAALIPRAGTSAHTPHTHPLLGYTWEHDETPGQPVGRVGLEPTT